MPPSLPRARPDAPRTPPRRVRAGAWLPLLAAACALPAPPVPRPVGALVLPLTWSVRPFHAIVLLWAVAAGALLARHREAWAWAAAALFVRATAAPPRILMGVDYAYVRWADGTGTVRATEVYGETWPSLMGLVWWLTGGVADHVQLANLVLSGLTVGGVYALLATLDGPRTARLGAGVITLLPLPVALASTETMFVAVALLQVTAVLGLTGGSRAHAAAAVASVALLLWLRPFQAFWVAAWVPVAWAAGRRGWAAAGAALLALRAIELLAGPLSGGVPSGAGGRSLARWAEPWRFLGPEGSLVVADPTVTPLALAPLALAAVVVARRGRGWVLSAAWLTAAAVVPYLHFERPTDVLRYQLPAHTGWAILAAAFLATLPRRVALGLGVGLVLTGARATTPLRPSFPWQQEDAVIREALPRLPAGSRVWFDAPWDRHRAFERWVNSRGHGLWRRLDRAAVRPDDLLWLGRAGARPSDCPGDVVARWPLTPRDNDVEHGLHDDVQLVRVIGPCAGAAAEGSDATP